MRENLYVIRLASDDEAVYRGNPVITETELRRRLRIIAPMDLSYHDGSDAVDKRDIYYLLYGCWPDKRGHL